MAISPLPDAFPFRRVAVLGSGGMLGQGVVQYFQQGVSEEDPVTVLPLTADEANLCNDVSSLQAILSALTPDVLINTAAYTDVDQAEIAHDQAEAVNHHGAQKLAVVAQALNIPLVHISTDYVFDGETETPYLPTDTPNPVSIYGRSKYRGEQAIQQTCPQHWIIRTSWLYGVGRANFVQFVMDSAQQKKTLNIVSDWTGSPTWTVSLAQMMAQIITTQPYGVYHAADEGVISKYQQACHIYQHLGLPASLITPVCHETLGFKARRPRFSVLACPGVKTTPWTAMFHQYCNTIGAMRLSVYNETPSLPSL